MFVIFRLKNKIKTFCIFVHGLKKLKNKHINKIIKKKNGFSSISTISWAFASTKKIL